MGALFKVYKSDGITEIANIKSVVFREAVNTGEYLIPGCVSSSEIEVEVFNTQPNAVAAGDVVYAYVYDNANNGTLLGKFNCEPRIETKNSYKFVAYDNALKLEADFSQWLQANQINFPYTIKQLVQQACTIAGVTLGSSSWPLSTQSVQAFYTDGLTCRDILSYAAELAGRFVRCHTDGNIYFDWFAANANSIAPSAGTGVYAYKQDGLTYANYTTTALARVAVHPSGEDDVAYIYPTGVTSGNTLHIKNNLLLTGADASFYNAAAQQVYTAVAAVGSYCPMSVNLFPRENPFRAGDIVGITDAQSVTISAPVMSVVISNAAATLVSDGRENYEDTTETAKAITQLASDVVRINKLKVDWADINTAIINYLTANDVTAQNLTIVDANDVVLATFNANGVTIGQTGQSRMEIDQNSFDLYDQDGNLYTSFGDLRDANGFATLTETKDVSSASTVITVEFPIYSVSSITVNGVATTAYTPKTPTDQSITFSNTIAANSTVVVEYLTESPVYHFDLGKRKSGETIGAWSAVNGFNQTASATFSTVSGGVNNSATGIRGTISGGGANEAGTVGSVGGGDYNRAVGNYSTVAGGYDNDATGLLSAVAGGQKNVASGVSSFAANEYNEAKGAYSVALGRANKASGNSQTAIGKFCVEDTQNTYAEIVGNGTSDNARSNARTLDWSGNETLAGGLTTGGNVSVGGDLSVTGSVSLGSALPVASGGTGASNASTALGNLGGFNLALGMNIPDNSDLNDYKTAGTYYVADSTHAATITNSPINTAGYKLVVLYAGATGQVHQEAYFNASLNRYYRYWNGSSWSAWRINLTTNNTIGIGNGGTGANTAADALTNIGGIRPNLLDNWYFVGGSQGAWGAFPINQRGQTQYTAAGYTIDRWKSFTAGPTVNVKSDCVNFVSGNAASYKRFMQYLPTNLVAGQTYTLSMLYKANSKSGTAALRINYNRVSAVSNGAVTGITTGGVKLLALTVTIQAGQAYDNAVEILVYNTSSDVLDIDIYAFKLELGSSQTLAHQENGTWVLNEMPNFQEELAKCQQYLFQICGVFRCRAAFVGTDAIQFAIPCPPQFAPGTSAEVATLINGNNIDVVAVNSATAQTGFTLSVLGRASNSPTLVINASKTSHGLTDAQLCITATTKTALVSKEL